MTPFTNDELIKIAGGVFAALTAFKGILEYTKANKVKTVELLNALIKEFNHKNLGKAKRLLDDFVICEPNDEDIEVKGNLAYQNSKFHKSNFETILRDHNQTPIENDKVLIQIRASFDSLLDFFTKVEYLMSLGLISKSEFFFFKYYLDKMLNDNNVLNYCQIYDFKAIFRLGYIFKAKMENKIVWDSFLLRCKGWVLRYLTF
jgi:hypothetical protein